MRPARSGRLPTTGAAPIRPLASGAFRFALVLAGVFALTSAVLLFLVAHLVDHYIAEGVADAVGTESDILVNEARERGPVELLHAVERHGRAVRDNDFRYLLLDAGGRRLAGTLPQAAARVGWSKARVAALDEEGAHMIDVLTRGVRLSDGALLVVAGDLEDLRELRARLLQFTALAAVVVVVLALVGGGMAGGLFLRRLDAVNAAIARIIQGNFAQRLPALGISPEFNALTSHLNLMLDRMEALVDSMRQISVDVAHDLRTPLTRLRHRLERIEASPAGAAVAGDLGGCIAEIDEVIAIFAAMLRISAVESGMAGAGHARIDLSALLGQLVAAYAPAIEDGGRRLALRIAPGVHIAADRELLAQAVANLLENAIRHTPPGSTIALGLDGAGLPGMARITVEDDGPGVPEADRERVLRRFFRLERSRTTPGSGLGLALVAAVVRLHHGTIVLEEAAPGLRVRLDLPIAAEGG
ncbi:MAG TPA: ATP-binding protein [Novosphingobium sp.]|nr:ATP-binding protein [Novosphingobium sp.]HZV11373.1 ATP-binding protein [Novosphingobium sp.]